jgi:Fe2+-dicitrate sensor, membrane component
MAGGLKQTNARSHRDDPVWEQALDWLMRVQASAQDGEVLRRRDAWLAESEAHARAYRKAEKVWRLTGDVVPAIPPGPAPVPAGSAFRTPRRILAAGALAAGLALFLLPDIRLRLQADHRTGIGETRQVSLDDGSVVHLDADSAIGLAFSPDRRRVSLLSGQAFFQVAADRVRPFTVTAGEVSVTVTGTAFDMRFAADSVAVEVQSGSVSVAADHGGRKVETRLAPGQRAVVARSGGALVTEAVSPVQVGLWRSGRMVVDGATVAQVVEDLRRHHRGIILLRDQALAARRVTGVFDVDDPVAALDAVLQPHGGVVRELTPYVLVVSAR